jgi:hypothetical protein
MAKISAQAFKQIYSAQNVLLLLVAADFALDGERTAIAQFEQPLKPRV